MKISIKLRLALFVACTALDAHAQGISFGKINRTTDVPEKVEPAAAAAVPVKKVPNKVVHKVTPKKIEQEPESSPYFRLVPVPTNGLRAALRGWGSKEQWTLKWADGVDDVVLPAGVRLDGNLESTVEVITKTVPADAKLQITMYEGNKVIHVHAR